MTRTDVKVGDKVKSKVYGHGVIKYDGYKLVGVRFNSGSYRAYRKDDWSSTLKDDSIEFIQPIKVGDTVTLIDNFYNHEKFKAEPRYQRKDIAKLKGRVFKFIKISILGDRAIHDTECRWSIPLELLRKADDGIHRHTPEQVAESQRIIGEIVAGFKFGQCYYIRDESDKELTIRYTAEEADGMHTITAHCSPHDEFNRTIGIMVALCKATGRKLPDWV